MGSVCRGTGKAPTVKESVSDKTFQQYIDDAKANKQFDVKTLDPYNKKEDIRDQDNISSKQSFPTASPTSSPVRKGIMNVFGDQDLDDEDGSYYKFMQNRGNSLGTKLGGALQGIFSLGPMSRLLGNQPSNVDKELSRAFQYANSNPNAVTLGEDGLSMAIDTGTGTINIGKNGFTTYTGRKNPDYDGPFANLVNPLTKDDDDDPIEAMDTSTPLDPCPDGFKYNQATETCEPVTQEDGDSFVKTESIATVIPELSRYGRDGGEYLFFSEMPGVADPMQSGGLPRQPSGEVTGKGGPKDDLVGPILLSAKEYVLPYEQVLAEGNGDYNSGIKTLENERKAALRKYANRTKSA